MTDVAERVSVVVPTRNNERTIAACLASVRAQDYPDVELIVVDNHSTDATPRIAQEYADRFEVAGPERSAQRNTGIGLATGPWIIWLDSDMILPPDAVSSAVATAEETGAAGVALPERTVGQGFWTACRALERECYLDQPGLHNPRLLRRDYLLNDGGFDLAMSGPEDADLRLRMRERGDRIALAPVIIDHDEGRLTLRDIWTKRFYYGLSIPALENEHDGAVTGQGRALLAAYVDNRGRLLRRPVHAVGMVAMRGMEAAGYLAGARAGRRRR
ncbi:glycosyltransferase [Branchiibius sp. NY16-3462-2]|uniref:glycosyltransferase family 2 protein n=1 Tax=Branchiibius sp. NY16-3462-2 TaxID=1807500 RepID=UPI000792A279|nr:glycosyltransferase [Branchiibius sp. NY16-3462-2]KYH44353.1 glycosyl transferase family 2 [Branchiibius sp. NY16-3462-2]